MEKSITCIGIDGCQSGWVSAYREDPIEWKFEIFPTIQDFWNKFSYTKLIMIDIPIGLRDNGSEPRLCDKAARKFLTRTRSSSIFPTPCRASLYAETYIEANQINRKLTGKGLSKQTWNISRKIKEVDFLLRNNSKARHIFIESHPELCFAALSNNTPMIHYKKKEDGIKERLLVIESFCNNPKQILNDVILQFSKEKLSVSLEVQDTICNDKERTRSSDANSRNLLSRQLLFEYSCGEGCDKNRGEKADKNRSDRCSCHLDAYVLENEKEGYTRESEKKQCWEVSLLNKKSVVLFCTFLKKKCNEEESTSNEKPEGCYKNRG